MPYSEAKMLHFESPIRNPVSTPGDALLFPVLRLYAKNVIQ